MKQQLTLHARDHLPGGSDPIPGVGLAFAPNTFTANFAWLSGGLVAAATGSLFPDINRADSSFDPDTYDYLYDDVGFVKFLKPGLYDCNISIEWSEGAHDLAYNKYCFLNFQDDVGDADATVDYPADVQFSDADNTSLGDTRYPGALHILTSQRTLYWARQADVDALAGCYGFYAHDAAFNATAFATIFITRINTG